jgi:hypothetical protein
VAIALGSVWGNDKDGKGICIGEGGVYRRGIEGCVQERAVARDVHRIERGMCIGEERWEGVGTEDGRGNRREMCTGEGCVQERKDGYVYRREMRTGKGQEGMCQGKESIFKKRF